MKDKLKDILMLLSWREIARQYFSKSSSWLYHKLDGIDPIKPEEKQKLKDSLMDISERIRKTAENL